MALKYPKDWQEKKETLNKIALSLSTIHPSSKATPDFTYLTSKDTINILNYFKDKEEFYKNDNDIIRNIYNIVLILRFAISPYKRTPTDKSNIEVVYNAINDPTNELIFGKIIKYMNDNRNGIPDKWNAKYLKISEKKRNINLLVKKFINKIKAKTATKIKRKNATGNTANKKSKKKYQQLKF
tara:strand:+ start:244 stop:792 length:549 start_codon:yes stop_codon:yes gene_type:complete